jgi:hypothetical protein
MRGTTVGFLAMALLAAPVPAHADGFMSMMDSANYSGVQFAGTLMINGAIDASTGGRRVTQAQVDAQNRDIKIARECKNAVIQRTPVGDARKAGLQDCNNRYPVKELSEYPANGRAASSVPAASTKQPAAVKPLSAQSGSYRASAAVTTEVQNSFYTMVKAGSKETAEEIRTKLFTQDVERLFGKTVSPFGLKSNDVVDSTTAFWVSMWVVANQAPNPSTKQIAAARKQVQQAISASGKLAASDADKQRLSQMMMYETILALVAFNTDSIDKTKLASATHKNMKRRGMDLRAMLLTDNGFTAR